MKRKSAFTLIEMMITIAVIGIIMGMVFKMFSIAMDKTRQARTQKVLEQTAFVLNEYYAEYGIYPPATAGANSVAYVYENVEATKILHPDSINYYSPGSASPHAPPREYGLVAYLVRCPPEDTPTFAQGQTGKEWLQDTDRDMNVKNKWAPFIEGLIYTDAEAGDGGSAAAFVKSRKTILDGWDQDLIYVCDAPYNSYRLWSKGRDKANNNGDGDDIVVDRMK